VDPFLHAQFAEIEWKHWWFRGRQAILADVLAFRMRENASLRILDVGCGAGAMVPVLARHGMVTGMDSSEDTVAFCKRLFPDATFLVGNVPEDLPGGEPFDLVCAFDVIEHIDDDIGALRGMNDVLATGGTLVATVPAHQWMWGPHDDLNEHKRRYTRRRLCAALTSSGYDVQWATYFNSFLFPVVAAVRLVRRHLLRRERPASDFVLPRHSMNEALTRLFGAERHLLRHAALPVGVSALAVATKR